MDRVLTQVSDAADVRDHALTSGDGRLALMASREERDALAFVVDRLGVADDGTRDALVESQALRAAVLDMIRESPELATVAARAVQEFGLSEIAEAMRTLGARHIERRESGNPTAPLRLVRTDPNQEAPR